MSEKILVSQTNGKIRKVACNQCDKKTNHKVLNSARYSWDSEEIQACRDYEIIQCLGCDMISFRIGSSNSEDYDELDDEGNLIYLEKEEIYPSKLTGRTMFPEVHYLPERLRTVYEETHFAICTKLRILAGVGVRTLIEAVCKEQSAKGKGLEKKIDDLVTKGVLTARNATILHKIRFLGNRAAHEAEAPSDEELDIAFDIVENLLETVYVIPRKSELLRDRKTK